MKRNWQTNFSCILIAVERSKCKRMPESTLANARIGSRVSFIQLFNFALFSLYYGIHERVRKIGRVFVLRTAFYFC